MVVYPPTEESTGGHISHLGGSTALWAAPQKMPEVDPRGTGMLGRSWGVQVQASLSCSHHDNNKDEQDSGDKWSWKTLG